jgi:hypothetical protein
MGVKRHKAAVSAYKQVAKEHKMKPCEMQAIAWVAWKGIKDESSK